MIRVENLSKEYDEVVAVRDLTLEIAEGVQIRVQRGQITQLVPKGTLKSA